MGLVNEEFIKSLHVNFNVLCGILRPGGSKPKSTFEDGHSLSKIGVSNAPNLTLGAASTCGRVECEMFHHYQASPGSSLITNPAEE